MLSLHKNDLKNVSILPIEGYGEEDMDASTWDGVVDETKKDATCRGAREWKDSVGGATVCCTVCCSILGYASLENVDTIRLFKHRLEAKHMRVKNGISYVENSFQHNTCGSFIAKEIIRFAEAQAIFTFAVIQKSSSTGKLHSCLLLKLLSWNTVLAKKCRDSHQQLQFKRVAKVIYEESELMTSDNCSSEDKSHMTWGGVDLCCESSTLSRQLDQRAQVMTSEASVRIFLSLEDWKALKEELFQGSMYYSKTVTRAATQVKLGKDGEQKKDSALLSILQLP